ADYYPYYALAADLDVPVAMQAGASGGMTPSECGRPMGIDRAALYFSDTRFVLSHTGWPWVDEAVALARKLPYVFCGTASYPPGPRRAPRRRPRVAARDVRPQRGTARRARSPLSGGRLLRQWRVDPRVRNRRRLRVPAVRRVRRRAALPLQPPARRRDDREPG